MPDSNSIELLVDNFADWEQSGHFMKAFPDFAAKPMGTYIDMDKVSAAHATGASPSEIHRRAYAGEFGPEGPVDPRVLMCGQLST